MTFIPYEVPLILPPTYTAEPLEEDALISLVTFIPYEPPLILSPTDTAVPLLVTLLMINIPMSELSVEEVVINSAYIPVPLLVTELAYIPY